jgi:hypothetical protein
MTGLNCSNPVPAEDVDQADLSAKRTEYDEPYSSRRRKIMTAINNIDGAPHYGRNCPDCAKLEEELERYRKVRKYLQQKRMDGRVMIKIATILLMLEQKHDA